MDSLAVHLELFNTLAQKYAYQSLDPSQLAEFRQLSAREFLQKIGVPFYRLPGLLQEGRRLLAERLEELQVFPGVKAVLPTLAEHNTLWVLSSTPRPILQTVLENNGVEQYFSQISSEQNLFGKHHALRRMLRNAGIPIHQAVYIGDEVRDIEACQKISLPVIAVEWGFTAGQRLQAAQPTWQIAEPQELLSLCV